jgi:hypothetical protein
MKMEEIKQIIDDVISELSETKTIRISKFDGKK